MAKSLEESLSSLWRIGHEPLSSASEQSLRQALASKTNAVVARAASVASDLEAHALIPALEQAFHRMIKNPLKTDPQCLGKNEVVKALDRLGAATTDLFLLGMRHVQMEPVFGGRVDTAAELRGLCAIALVRTGHPDALFDVLPLLTDSEPEARVGGVQAVAGSQRHEAEYLLRLKTLAGDSHLGVLSECFRRLLEVFPERSVDFVSQYLASNETAVAEEAAWALGESRRPEAFRLLRARWEDEPDAEYRRVLLLAVGAMRSEESLNFLQGIIRDESARIAGIAIEALKVWRENEAIISRVRAVVEERDDPPVTQAFEQMLATKG